MKLQACSFQETKDSPIQIGFAKVDYFGCNVEWIINENGERIKDIWDYNLKSHEPGHLAEFKTNGD